MSEVGVPGEGDARQALAAEVARLWRRVAELEGSLKTLGSVVVGSAAMAEEIEDLRSKVGELAAVVTGLVEVEEQRTRPERAIWWPDVTNLEDRRAAWNLLGAWVDEVLRGRHPELYKSLKKCWYQHPDVVDELSALRVAWYGAYRDPRASATGGIGDEAHCN